MRVAIIGSRSLNVDISKFVPKDTTEIISGGRRGIDLRVEMYADEHNIPKLIIKPKYYKYGICASKERYKAIVDVSDKVVAIWDSRSSGTKYIIDYARQIGKTVDIVIMLTGKK